LKNVFNLLAAWSFARMRTHESRDCKSICVEWYIKSDKYQRSSGLEKNLQSLFTAAINTHNTR